MKKAFFVAGIMALLSFSSVAQTVSESAVKRTEEYCIMRKVSSGKLSITVDYGTGKNLFPDMYLRDKDNKVIQNATVVDALNYLNSQGWEFVQAMPLETVNTNNNVETNRYGQSYLLKRKISQ